MYSYGAERYAYRVNGSPVRSDWRDGRSAATRRKLRPALQVIVWESSEFYDVGSRTVRTTGYAELLADRDVFLDMLRDFVDEEWVGRLDPQRVSRLDPPVAAPRMPGRDREVVYSVPIGNRELIIIVLTLTKPSPRLLMPFLTLAEWFDRLVDERLKAPEYGGWDPSSGGRSEIVILAIYNGKAPWTVPLHFHEMAGGFGEPRLSTELPPGVSYLLIDIHRYEKRHLLELPSLMAAVFLLEQSVREREVFLHLKLLAGKLGRWKAAKRRRFLRWFVETVGVMLPEEASEQLATVLAHSEREGIEAMIANVERVLKHALLKQRMHAYAEGMEEGRAEGRREVARRLLEHGMSLPQVHALTGVPQEQLVELLRR